MSANDVRPGENARQRHWARTRTLTVIALAAWLVFSLVVPWFARELNSITFLGFPLGYYMVAQGAPIVFVVILFWQNRAQDRADDKFGIGE